MNAIKSITPKAAFDLIEQEPRAIFVDVRSSMEFLFVGHPKGAINIAWIDEPDWSINPDFVKQVRKLVLGGVHEQGSNDSVPVILICRSGVRSLDAGEILLQAGFSRVYNVLEGFEGALNANHQRSTVGGWRFHGLPWEQC
ncbi:rhodanese-like domain-containing protein [Candidatus Venteria ishoeyi]|uniref:rhodanese-like domain-containing protein n=1 Tax=Candidatus Venteria ishoeyi TaxID=1899563 RepID=UPI0025A6161F|nr:rhodanese-like domain-containing protein [Candidatus Venteria ishoeyi]MDM8545091.1 rhodanese-like domain-containing protein [Candidatus Venteria ishoeyi]